MNKKILFYVLTGMGVGAMFGSAFRPVLSEPLIGVLGGAMAGVFLGWFTAVAAAKRNPGARR